MHINLINLPAAILTILFRRIIDGYIGKAVKILPRGPWLIEHVAQPNVLYLYLIGAGLAYFVKHYGQRTLVSMAETCTASAGQLKDKYVVKKRRWLERNKSWALKNLLSNNRENQKLAMAFLSSQIPNQNQIADDIDKLLESTSASRLRPTTTTTTETPADVIDLTREPSTFLERNNSATSSSNRSCTNSEMAVYTPSVIGEIIPGDDETFKSPGSSVRGGRNKRISGRPDGDIKRRLSSNLGMVRKTRSGRIYGYSNKDRANSFGSEMW